MSCRKTGPVTVPPQVPRGPSGWWARSSPAEDGRALGMGPSEMACGCLEITAGLMRCCCATWSRDLESLSCLPRRDWLLPGSPGPAQALLCSPGGKMGTCASRGTLVPAQLPQGSRALPVEQPLCRTGVARAAGPASCVGTSQGPALPQRWEGGTWPVPSPAARSPQERG